VSSFIKIFFRDRVKAIHLVAGKSRLGESQRARERSHRRRATILFCRIRMGPYWMRFGINREKYLYYYDRSKYRWTIEIAHFKTVRKISLWAQLNITLYNYVMYFLLKFYFSLLTRLIVQTEDDYKCITSRRFFKKKNVIRKTPHLKSEY